MAVTEHQFGHINMFCHKYRGREGIGVHVAMVVTFVRGLCQYVG